MTTKADVIIIGASASGLMCAIEAGKRGRSVIVLDHANKAGKKILMSGGGRCNFTNYQVDAENYLSHNPHFCKSALSRFTQWDFLALVNQYQIPFHERNHGQLFCDESAKDILNMLLTEARLAGVKIALNTEITTVDKIAPDKFDRDTGHGFDLRTKQGNYHGKSLVVASGGLSIPRMGASPFGYKLAERFNIKVWPTRAGLVPFTLQPSDKAQLAELSGIAIDTHVSTDRQGFRENTLFTHRGLSGPAILQISSYWRAAETVSMNLCPAITIIDELKALKQQRPQLHLNNALHNWLPKRIIATLLKGLPLGATLQSLSSQQLEEINEYIHHWKIKPNGTEGYRTAEVTIGGVDCDALSSKTMESSQVRGLFFIGEVVDVTGWLGGYNFQWAWASGWCAGQYT
ncbi:Uncharacterized protein YhiN [hydrothermal vent metagenome]|uniref:Uncharacterized protein YhiN n=1 Tax=hydrothermal vent metagenome TaxID=652676 RepID=A0A3B0ZFL8_9ZZZZ